MMRLFYCPECNKEEIRNDDPYKNEYTISNMRDGYGRPIRHYKCECGNYLAGSMDVDGWVDDKDAIEYCKVTIKGYNRGGCYYDFSGSFDGNTDLFERAKMVYKDRKQRGLRRESPILEQRMNGEYM